VLHGLWQGNFDQKNPCREQARHGLFLGTVKALPWLVHFLQAALVAAIGFSFVAHADEDALPFTLFLLDGSRIHGGPVEVDETGVQWKCALPGGQIHFSWHQVSRWESRDREPSLDDDLPGDHLALQDGTLLKGRLRVLDQAGWHFQLLGLPEIQVPRDAVAWAGLGTEEVLWFDSRNPLCWDQRDGLTWDEGAWMESRKREIAVGGTENQIFPVRPPAWSRSLEPAGAAHSFSGKDSAASRELPGWPSRFRADFALAKDTLRADLYLRAPRDGVNGPGSLSLFLSGSSMNVWFHRAMGWSAWQSPPAPEENLAHNPKWTLFVDGVARVCHVYADGTKKGSFPLPPVERDNQNGWGEPLEEVFSASPFTCLRFAIPYVDKDTPSGGLEHLRLRPWDGHLPDQRDKPNEFIDDASTLHGPRRGKLLRVTETTVTFLQEDGKTTEVPRPQITHLHLADRQPVPNTAITRIRLSQGSGIMPSALRWENNECHITTPGGLSLSLPLHEIQGIRFPGEAATPDMVLECHCGSVLAGTPENITNGVLLWSTARDPLSITLRSGMVLHRPQKPEPHTTRARPPGVGLHVLHFDSGDYLSGQPGPVSSDPIHPGIPWACGGVSFEITGGSHRWSYPLPMAPDLSGASWFVLPDSDERLTQWRSAQPRWTRPLHPEAPDFHLLPPASGVVPVTRTTTDLRFLSSANVLWQLACADPQRPMSMEGTITFPVENDPHLLSEPVVNFSLYESLPLDGGWGGFSLRPVTIDGKAGFTWSLWFDVRPEPPAADAKFFASEGPLHFRFTHEPSRNRIRLFFNGQLVEDGAPESRPPADPFGDNQPKNTKGHTHAAVGVTWPRWQKSNDPATPGPSPLEKSTITLSDWRVLPAGRVAAKEETGANLIRLRNGDEIVAKLNGFSKGNLKIENEQSAFTIPIDRVASSEPLSSPPVPRPAPHVTIHLVEGGFLSFPGPVSASNNEITGHHPNLGFVKIPWNSVRTLVWQGAPPESTSPER
jgi:hypothetical protein